MTEDHKHKPLPCTAKNPDGCKGKPHRCYLYLNHYGPHKAKPCMHAFEEA